MAVQLYHDGTPVDGSLCEPGTLRRGFGRPFTFDVFYALPFDQPPPWENNDEVRLEVDGATVFRGRVTSVERQASASDEGIRFYCSGLREQARGVVFRKVVRGALTSRLVYNCPREEQELEAPHVVSEDNHLTVGDIIADILDTMAPELANIIGHGQPGSGYDPDQIAALAVVPPKVVFDGLSVVEAIDAVLRHAPNFAWFIDPGTTRAVFVDLSALSDKDIPGLNASVISHALTWSIAECYTACTVEGARERVDIYDGSLQPDWNPAYEADWSLMKALQFPDTYGAVFRKWRCPAAVADGGTLWPRRAVGNGEIVCLFLPSDGSAEKVFYCLADAADDGTSVWLRGWASEATSDGSGYRACPYAGAWYTYARGSITGRFPASGFSGTAYTRRGLEREKIIRHDDLGRVTAKGDIDALIEQGPEAGRAFLSHYTLWFKNELAGRTITFTRTGETCTIESNTHGKIVLTETPTTPLQVGDTYTVTLRDDAAPRHEGLSALELIARDYVERHGDEKCHGSVPLDGLDWSISLGQRINFTDTADPELASLGATLLEVTHDFPMQRTILTLTSERSMSGARTWREVADEREKTRQLREQSTQARRLWRIIRAGRGPGHVPDQGAGQKNDDPAWLPGFDSEVVSGNDWIDVSWKKIDRSKVYTVSHALPTTPTGVETTGAGEQETGVIVNISWDEQHHFVAATARRLATDQTWIDLELQDGDPDTYFFSHIGPCTGQSGAHHYGETGKFVALVHADERGHVFAVSTGALTGDDWIAISPYQYCDIQVRHSGPAEAVAVYASGLLKRLEVDARGHVVDAAATGKTAILKLGGDWRGLFCLEAPECRFLDLMTITLEGTTARCPIDPLFLEACEPGSMVAFSAVPQTPLPGTIACRVEGSHVVVETIRPPERPVSITVAISGLRRGATDRFPVFSEAVARRNQRFWAQAHCPTGD